MAASFTQWLQVVNDNLLKNNVLEGIDSKFRKTYSDRESVELIFQNICNFDFPIKEYFLCKSNEKSNNFRQDGNQLYSKGKFSQALLSYSKSICHAKSNSKELGLAYANRSAVLFSLDEINICQTDIRLAIEHNYPDKLLYKLYERQARCYEKNGNTESALKYCEKCLDNLNISNENEAKKKDIENRVNKFKKSLTNHNGNSNISISNTPNQLYFNVIPLLPSLNKVYLSTSNSFSITNDEKEGRYAIANSTIYPGEIIVVEKPYSSICVPSSFETHCYSCFKRFKVCYPCRQCVAVRYCSVSCEQSTWEKFHQFECKYLNILTLNDIGLGHLALKMIVQTSMSKLHEANKKSSIIFENGGLNENNVFDSLDYNCVYSLVGNREQRSSKDLFRRTLIAFFLTKILRLSNFFEIVDSEFSSDDAQILVSQHILKQLQMLPCNAHEVSELKVTDNDYVSSELIEIGSAVYTTLSLLNHSCDPSVVRHCYGDVCVLRAIKRIDQGEQIVDNYGHLYPVEEKDARLKHLNEQYYFTCACIACVENWPLYNDIPDSKPEFLCENCSNKVSFMNPVCTICDADSKTNERLKLIPADFQEKMKTVLDTGKFEDVLDYMLNTLDIVSSKALLPTLFLNNCQEIVKLCFSLQGNCVKLKS